MSDLINQLLDGSNIPALTAFILGLLTAISPCPLFTNVTAVGFISKNIDNRRRVFLQGLAYTLGRTLAYTALGAILIFILREGADIFGLQQTISEWGELILGPALIVVGVFMLFGHMMHLPKVGFNGLSSDGKFKGTAGAFMLGTMFAMAFCPTSGLFYFGMLIPMSAESTGGYLLPLVFAIATSLPVLVVAWFIAFSMHNVGKLTGSISTFQRWLNRIVAVLFIGVGIYYSVNTFI